MRRALILFFATAITALFAWAHWPSAPLPQGVKADHILVSKSARELTLMRNGEVLRRYNVSLGANPVGHKQRKVDERTPEGEYTIDYRKDDSSFHRALHISYPNEADIRRASEKGEDPGGLIMIHGLPNRAPFLGRLHRLVDWTDGCVAVTNREIEQIWQAVDDGTRITIRR